MRYDYGKTQIKINCAYKRFNYSLHTLCNGGMWHQGGEGYAYMTNLQKAVVITAESYLLRGNRAQYDYF